MLRILNWLKLYIAYGKSVLSEPTNICMNLYAYMRIHLRTCITYVFINNSRTNWDIYYIFQSLNYSIYIYLPVGKSLKVWQ